MNYAVNIAQQIIEGKTPTHAQLGVSLSTVNSQNAKRYGLKVDSGAYISAVNSGSRAAEAGLEEGDIVTKFDGNSVSSASDLMLDVRSKNPGDKVTLEVNRNGDTKQVEVTLGSDESSQSAATQQNSGSSSSEMLNRLLNNRGSSSKNDAFSIGPFGSSRAARVNAERFHARRPARCIAGKPFSFLFFPFFRGNGPSFMGAVLFFRHICPSRPVTIH